jgi:hypothetical protein
VGLTRPGGGSSRPGSRTGGRWRRERWEARRMGFDMRSPKRISPSPSAYFSLRTSNPIRRERWEARRFGFDADGGASRRRQAGPCAGGGGLGSHPDGFLPSEAVPGALGSGGGGRGRFELGPSTAAQAGLDSPQLPRAAACLAGAALGERPEPILITARLPASPAQCTWLASEGLGCCKAWRRPGWLGLPGQPGRRTTALR